MPHRANLSHTRHRELVDEVVLSTQFTEEEINLILTRDVAGADEGGLWWKTNKRMERGENKIKIL